MIEMRLKVKEMGLLDLDLDLSLSSPKRFHSKFIKNMHIPHIMYPVNLLFFPFMFGIFLKVSVRLINWSQFHSSHLYYEKY